MKREVGMFVVILSLALVGCHMGTGAEVAFDGKSDSVGTAKKAMMMDGGSPPDVDAGDTSDAPDIDAGDTSDGSDGGATPDYQTQTDGANQTPELSTQGRVIYIVCFYGANDSGRLARNMCAIAYQQCQASFGRACRRVNNPSQSDLDRLRADQTALVYVVTHSTPNANSPDDNPTDDPSGIDIWDSDLCPGDVSSHFCGTPVIWYGCYGMDIQQCYNNVVSPQTSSGVLNSGDPRITCMMLALTQCAQAAARNGSTFTQAQLHSCARQRAPNMGPACRGLTF